MDKLIVTVWYVL